LQLVKLLASAKDAPAFQVGPSWAKLSATLLNSLACNARYILETIHSPTVAEGWTYKVATMIISFGKLASEYQRG